MSGPSVSSSVSVFHQLGSFILEDKEAENFLCDIVLVSFPSHVVPSFS